MKINLTKKQYLTLIEALGTASFPIGIMSDFAEDEEIEVYKDKHVRLDELRSHVHSFSKEFGFDEFFETGPVDKNIYVKDEYIDMFGGQTIFDFEEWSLFSTLIQDLAARDYAENYSDSEREKMKKKSLYSKIDALEKKYAKEFEENGLSNLRIKEEDPVYLGSFAKYAEE